MRNPFTRLAKRNPARPSLRERAASLKASASRVIRRKPVDAAPADLPAVSQAEGVSPELAAMVAEWVMLTERQANESFSDEEGSAISAQWSELQGQICAFPARGFADLCAKLPVYRYERDDDREWATGGVSMTLRAWDSMVRDIEAMSVAPVPAQGSDPILSMIEEGRRLLIAYLDAHATIPQDPTTIEPPEEWGAAGRALWAHIDTTILKTVPRTAAGCRELARFADEYFEANEVPISDDEMAVLRLIAQSPLLKLFAGGADVELLALGREFDALHAEWLLACIASQAAEEKAAALSSDLQRRKGWTAVEINEASLAQPV